MLSAIDGGRARSLVLASTSPYRRELLTRLGLPFSVSSPNTDETPLAGETPADMALRLARDKAASVRHDHPDALIIGSDQVADLEGEPIGKPGSADAARALLRRLSGRTVVFHTGLALLDGASGVCQASVVDVRSTFRALEPHEINTYIEREQAFDCAGGVKVEALGIVLLAAVESDDPTALIGLPLIRLVDMLQNAGVRPLG